MRVIIAGSRNFNNYSLVQKAIDESEMEITTVISGNARGVDLLGERWANENNIPLEIYPADWKPAHLNGKTDRSAGYKRNALMAEHADGLVAIWDGESKGTRHMIDIAVKNKLRVFVYCPIERQLDLI